MHMTFEKIETPKTPKPEHPAARAARMIKELHQQNIKMMDDGHVFLRDGVDVNEEMRKSCEDQIAQCDRIIARAEQLDPKHWAPSALILEEMQTTVAEAVEAQKPLASILPEIGNYDHEQSEPAQPNGLHDDGCAPAAGRGDDGSGDHDR